MTACVQFRPHECTDTMYVDVLASNAFNFATDCPRAYFPSDIHLEIHKGLKVQSSRGTWAYRRMIYMYINIICTHYIRIRTCTYREG